MHPTASVPVQRGIGLVSALAAAAIALGDLRQGGRRLAPALAGWLALTFAIAASGALLRWAPPPPLMGIVLVALVGAIALARGSAGARLAALPLPVLVGFQAFRLPLELAMHAAAAEGTMPPQMSFGPGGLNYDIVTGASAVLVALLAWRGRAPRALLWAFSALGLTLLAVIAVIAIASTPTFSAFGPTRLNTFVAYPPFVWLGAIDVPAALLGHLVLLRRLRAT